MTIKRRNFISKSVKYSLGTGAIASLYPILGGCQSNSNENNQGEDESDTNSTSEVIAAATPFFTISLAQWSFNNTIFDGNLDNLDFAETAKSKFGITAVEYVNQFFADKGNDSEYLKEMKLRTDDNGITNVLIMIDREGSLGTSDQKEREQAVENHYKWVEAAKFLGCHSIRVNARGEGSDDEIAASAIDGLGKLSEFAKDFDINVIVENHGGPSSNGKWLSNVLGQVGMDNCGSLPDFGNFCITRGENGCDDEYDRYLGTTELMPFAKGVSAKTHHFDDDGNCAETDYEKMLGIVKKAGYTGYVGIEYEGKDLEESVGIQKTLDLLIKNGGKV